MQTFRYVSWKLCPPDPAVGAPQAETAASKWAVSSQQAGYE